MFYSLHSIANEEQCMKLLWFLNTKVIVCKIRVLTTKLGLLLLCPSLWKIWAESKNQRNSVSHYCKLRLELSVKRIGT